MHYHDRWAFIFVRIRIVKNSHDKVENTRPFNATFLEALGLGVQRCPGLGIRKVQPGNERITGEGDAQSASRGFDFARVCNIVSFSIRLGIALTMVCESTYHHQKTGSGVETSCCPRKS